MAGVKKRFIAGAQCPQCKALDRLRVYREAETDYRECVACGFREAMHFKPVSRELQTRVNLSPEQRAAETQPVRLLDPASPSPASSSSSPKRRQ